MQTKATQCEVMAEKASDRLTRIREAIADNLSGTNQDTTSAGKKLEFFSKALGSLQETGMEVLTYRMNNRQISFHGLTPPGLAHDSTPPKKARQHRFIQLSLSSLHTTNYRLVVRRDSGRVRLLSRGGRDYDKRFPWIVEAARNSQQRVHHR